MKNIIYIAIVAITMFILMNVGYDKHMEVYCNTLVDQAEEYRGNPAYYITQLDHDECSDRYGIEINAIVK